MAKDPLGQPTGQRLLLGTRAGMTVDEVLAILPGAVRYQTPADHATSGLVVLAGHDDIEVAGVDANVRFGFTDGALAAVTIRIHHDSSHGEAVFAVQQLVVLLVEQFGTATTFADDAAGRGAVHQVDSRAIHVAWTNGAEVELQVTVRDGQVRGILTASRRRRTN